MNCCLQEGQKFKEKHEPEPFKFRLLGMLGLKQYLIDKYVFARGHSTYQIDQVSGQYVIRMPQIFNCHFLFNLQVRIIQQQKHSIPVAMLKLKRRSQYRGTVIYSHGNSSDLWASLDFINRFASTFAHMDYVVYDYTGYGRSNLKQITQQGICQDLSIVVRQLRVPLQEIILWGFSLGAYPTTMVAGRMKVKGVILQSPLASMYGLFTDELTCYSTFKNDIFSVLQNIGSIDSFIVIVHSTQDELIPFSHAKAIFDRYRMLNSNPYCFLLEVSQLKHNQMHRYLCSQHHNHLRASLHYYLHQIINHNDKQTSKSLLFQLQKLKYFEHLDDMQQSQIINLDEELMVLPDVEPNERNIKNSINLPQIKNQQFLVIQDIANEESFHINQLKREEHSMYFLSARNQQYQTEGSSIRIESQASSFLQ